MKVTKEKKGITLIALVITIILLLILAGISIQALTNQGLFAQAQNAKEATKMANAREQIMIVLNEWQMEKIINSANLEKFLNKKVTENSIDRFEKADEDEKYNIYKDSYVVVIDTEGNIVEDIQKSGPKPEVSNIKITTDGTTEVADNSQKTGAKLQINFDTSIENGTIKSVTPEIPYTTNGTETEINFIIVGTVNGTDYRKTQKVSIENKYNKIFKGTTVEEAIEYGDVLNISENKELRDSKNNKIVIPAGFKIVSDSTTSNAQTVDKGIVVEDVTGTDTNGSQFVWIPVGTITKADNITTTINLNRYTFDSNGKEKEQDENVIETYYSEEISGSGNTAAKSIADFKASVSANGGYYIGRYEARKNTTSGKTTEIKTDTVWNNITQPDAATQARNMYDNTNQFTSDLINSYAWDTTIVFMQNCTNTKYSLQTSLNGSLATTGTTIDVQCNIYDMASNILEWTTETSSNSDRYCVQRGGLCYDSRFYLGGRYNDRNSYSDDYIGFRPILYL